MVSGLPLVRLSLPLLACLACATPRVADVQFRTVEPETALERAATALSQSGHGVHRVDPQTGRVLTRWKDADVKVGLSYVFYRYVATVLPDPAHRAAWVQLHLEAVTCSLVDTRDPDRMANECRPSDRIPKKVQESFQRTTRVLEQDLLTPPRG